MDLNACFPSRVKPTGSSRAGGCPSSLTPVSWDRVITAHMKIRSYSPFLSEEGKSYPPPGRKHGTCPSRCHDVLQQIHIKGSLTAPPPLGSGTSKGPRFTPERLQPPGRSLEHPRGMKDLICSKEPPKPETFSYLRQHQEGLALPSWSLRTALPSPNSPSLGC